MTFMVILSFLVFIALVMVSGFVPRRSSVSIFELQRRDSVGDKQAMFALHRESLISNILSLQRSIEIFLLVLFVAFTLAGYGWFIGILLSIIGSIGYAAIARIGLVQHLSQELYEQYEPALLKKVAKFGGFMQLLPSVSSAPPQPTKVDSREELEHLLANSAGVLSVDEKKLITHALKFEHRLVSEVMTPRSMIDSISKNELLGPLVLDDLHRTGHTRFPVTDGDADHIVGILHIQSLLALDHKRSLTAGKTMEPRVYYIHQDQTLSHALNACLKTHHQLLVVINEFRETVGLISLEDVIEALMGRKIVDEDDVHDDLRAVATRNLHGNNEPEKHDDV